MTEDIHEIRSNFGNTIAAALNEADAKRSEVRRRPTAEYDSAIPTYVSDETRRQLIDEARQADVAAVEEEAKERIEAAIRSYPEAVERRRQKLREEIMEPLADANPDLLSRLAMSFEDDLEDQLSAALMVQNRELVNAIFVEAVRRDLPALKRRIAEEQGGIYSEWVSLPDQEAAEAKASQQRFLANQHLS